MSSYPIPPFLFKKGYKMSAPAGTAHRPGTAFIALFRNTARCSPARRLNRRECPRCRA
ncbi:hypothetical protein BACCAP_01333 [Pseudoflavonifractor capillosus ATCC 29799]|uniref:Uncharacterized protein n=1 Tax=Pseudoflavonifractor capillosus ATCC 29799 TaxID=411467 RepID=A6NT03_9FIRM|nr:hypothetical protein BACCAP_01333 [Pseudoflavonifractor capillosus ATCC 29799]